MPTIPIETQCECCFVHHPAGEVTAVPVPTESVNGKTVIRTTSQLYLADVLMCRRCEHVYKLICESSKKK